MATASLYSAKVSGGLPRRSLPLLRFFFLGRFSFLRATPYLPDRGSANSPLGINTHSAAVVHRAKNSARRRQGGDRDKTHGRSAVVGRFSLVMVYVCSEPARTTQEVIPMKKATIRVPGIKVAVPLKADAIPRNLVPMEGPAGEPVIELVLEGSTLTVVAKLNGKSYRKMLKTIAEHGKDNVVVVLQGVMRDPGGGEFDLDGAGFQINVKSPPPAPARQASGNVASSLPASGATGSSSLT